MNNQLQTLANAYNRGAQEEYLRLETPEGQSEYHQVKKMIAPHLRSNSVILDIGSGPGRYATDYLSMGHRVGCVDIAVEPLNLMRNKLTQYQARNLLFSQVSCASNLHWIPTPLADLILLMGPMYHLTNDRQRKQVLQHCHRILKPEGSLFIMYLGLSYPEKYNIVPSESQSSVTTTRFQGFDVAQFRMLPTKAIQESKNYFYPIEQMAIEQWGERLYRPKIEHAAQYIIHYKKT